MLNIHLSYKTPISWSILFCSGGYPTQFSRLKKFKALVVPSGVCHKGIILQEILTPTGVLPNEQSCLRRKGDVTGASVHAPINRNSMYIQNIRQSIYNTILPEHPHSLIFQYKQLPKGTASRPHYIVCILFIPVVGQSRK